MMSDIEMRGAGGWMSERNGRTGDGFRDHW